MKRRVPKNFLTRRPGSLVKPKIARGFSKLNCKVGFWLVFFSNHKEYGWWSLVKLENLCSTMLETSCCRKKKQKNKLEKRIFFKALLGRNIDFGHIGVYPKSSRILNPVVYGVISETPNVELLCCQLIHPKTDPMYFRNHEQWISIELLFTTMNKYRVAIYCN